jgi:hypothetical protein
MQVIYEARGPRPVGCFVPDAVISHVPSQGPRPSLERWSSARCHGTCFRSRSCPQSLLLPKRAPPLILLILCSSPDRTRLHTRLHCTFTVQISACSQPLSLPEHGRAQRDPRGTSSYRFSRQQGWRSKVQFATAAFRASARILCPMDPSSAQMPRSTRRRGVSASSGGTLFSVPNTEMPR